MNTDELLKLSVNKNFRDKNPIGGDIYYVDGFEPFDVTIEQLDQVVSNGWAFSYQYTDGIRKSKNFVCTDFLAADFDRGVSVNDGLKLDTVKRYGSLFYTTSSHSVDENRFRVVFALPRTITDPEEVRYASRALAQRLGSDHSVTDPARMFFGSKGCYSRLLGSRISNDFLDELIEDGRLAASTFRTNGNTPTGHRSYLRIKPEEVIRLGSGRELTFGEIKDKETVYCPFHPDGRASAFVSQSDGDSYLHCSACQKTWWSTTSKSRWYDFESFENRLKLIKAEAIEKTPDELVGLEPFIDDKSTWPVSIFLQDKRYLESQSLGIDTKQEGVTLIKSPKGSGKTTFLASILRTVTQRFNSLEEFEENEDPEVPEPFHTNEKVLLIGHRQALIGELCQRLHLNCYLDYPEKFSDSRHSSVKTRYGVCLDSLRRVADFKYDVIVIDEVEQVLGHFLSETISVSRDRIFEVFFHLIRQARHVIALDADLGWATLNTLKMIKSLSVEESSKLSFEKKSCPITVVLNQYHSDTRDIYLYSNQDHLIKQLCSYILDEKKVFITSNSKKKIDALTKVIEDLGRKSKREIPYIAITSSNSKSTNSQDFIKNVADRILDYQVVLSSPSLGTGIDISFPNDAQEIDVVVGLFEAGVTNHFEIDQQIARVRNPSEICVWVSPQRANFETTFEVVVDDVLRGDLIGGIRYGLGWKDRQTIADEDPFLTMAALLTAKNRASQNNLKSNFVRHKEKQGWTVHVVENVEALADDGKRLLRMGVIRSTAEETERILAASVLNRTEYRDLQRIKAFENSPVSETEQYDMHRTALELFYRQKASSALIALDNNGRFRENVRLFEALQKIAREPHLFKAHFKTDDSKAIKRTKLELDSKRLLGAGVLHSLLSTTPVYADGVFDLDAEYTQADLSEFAHLSVKSKRFVEGQFGLQTRSDISRKSIQHLGSLLKLVGLKHEPFRSEKIKGERIRYYKVADSEFRNLQEIIQARSKTEPWSYLNNAYGFEYTIQEIERFYEYFDLD